MFWIELSYRYGRTVDELQTLIDSAHFVELMAAEIINPQGESRADLRMGIIAATVANSAPFRARGSKSFEPKDFMPQYVRKPKTSKEIMAQFRLLTEAHGGIVKKGNNHGG